MFDGINHGNSLKVRGQVMFTRILLPGNSKSKNEWAASSKFGIYRLCEQWVKKNLHTESQIPGPSEWLGMRS